MDIQEMVDRRIAELRAESGIRFRPAGIWETRPQEDPSPVYDTVVQEDPDVRREHDRTSLRHETNSRIRPVDELVEFGEIMDAALTKVAGQVLEITEQLAGDYARLEKNILKTRLEALQAVESVLDIALFLRREARERLSMIEDGLRDQPTVSLATPLSQPEAFPMADGNGRASMHEGVAALFRRTL